MNSFLRPRRSCTGNVGVKAAPLGVGLERLVRGIHVRPPQRTHDTPFHLERYGNGEALYRLLRKTDLLPEMPEALLSCPDQ